MSETDVRHRCVSEKCSILKSLSITLLLLRDCIFESTLQMIQIHCVIITHTNMKIGSQIVTCYRNEDW
jgi:hypothetical protein